MKSIFSLNQNPWRFMFLFMLAWVVCNILVTISLRLIFGLNPDAQIPSPWVPVLTHILTVFIVAPFVLGFPGKTQTYTAYLSEIRLTKVQPLLGLILLGFSCYLILALFLRFYDQHKAILFSALGFGLIHILTLLEGRPPVWTAGQVVWAAILGLFYGYVTLKTGSLLPAMLVHYLGNLLVAAINAYIQQYASIPMQAVYGVVFTLGIVPVLLMMFWTRIFSSWTLWHDSG